MWGELMKLGKAIYIIAITLMLTLLMNVVMQIPYTYSQAAIPREDTVYVIGVQWGPSPGFNLLSPSFSGFGTTQSLPMYVPLFVYSALKDMWIPMIAEKYEWVDAYTIRVYIRPEATWSDGKPITAYDVEYTYYVVQQIGVGPGTGCWDYVEYMKAVGDKVLEARIKDPPKNYYSFIGCVLGYIPMPKHVIQPLFEQKGKKITEWRNDDPRTIVVSGPGKLYYYDENIIIIERLDNWWGANIFGLPKPKYVAHVIYKDNPSANSAFERGDADWAGTFIPSVWDMFKEGIGTWYKSKPYYVGSGLNPLYLNLRKPIFQNAALRKAIAYAIPYNEMLERAYYGYSTQASFSFVADHFNVYKDWIDKNLCLQYWGSEDCRPKTDLTQAAKILDEAGIVDRDGDGIRELPDGTKLTGITISVPYGWTDWMMMCEMIAENLRRIGIDVQTYFPDFSVWWNNIIEGKFDMIIGWSTGIGYDHPWNVYRWILDPRLTPPAGNWEGYNNSIIVSLIDEAASTIDPVKKKEIFSRIQEIIYKDIPVIPLFWGAHWYAYNTKYWVGWPNEENPWWWPTAPWDQNSWIILFGIAKKGGEPQIPAWLKPVDQGGILIPTSKIWSDLSNLLTATTSPPTTSPSPTTTTPVATPISTIVTTTTITSTKATTVVVPTTVTQTVTEWTITIVLAIVLLIVGFAIGYFIKRK